MKTYRIIVAVDVKAESLVDAAQTVEGALDQEGLKDNALVSVEVLTP